MDEDAFKNVDKNNCRLKVFKGRKSNYKNHSFWKQFRIMEEMTL